MPGRNSKNSDTESFSIRKTFGKNLRCARLAAGMTQRALSEKTGIMVYFISNLERGQRGLSLDHAILLANALSVPLAKLIDPDACKQDSR